MSARAMQGRTDSKCQNGVGSAGCRIVITQVVVEILVEPGVPDPVPALCSSGRTPVAAGHLGYCAGW